MGRNVSIFSRESGENRTTNYCLLLLKMFYEENPNLLSEVLATLMGEQMTAKVGVKFQQQEKRPQGRPDGVIRQDSITIYLETKSYDWFYDEQLKRHLADLKADQMGFKVLIALAKFASPEEIERKFAKVRELCRTKYKNEIAFAAITFDDLVNALQGDSRPKNLADAVLDFQQYLAEENLLSDEKDWLDVVNCAQTAEEVINGRVYLCPAASGAYNHYRCAYFGMYREKRVEKIASIEGVLDLESKDESEVKWINGKTGKRALEASAREAHSRFRPGEFPARVFVLGELYDTDFRKDAPGGMFNSKRYFYVKNLHASDAKDLAGKLNGKNWSDPDLKR